MAKENLFTEGLLVQQRKKEKNSSFAFQSRIASFDIGYDDFLNLEAEERRVVILNEIDHPSLLPNSSLLSLLTPAKER